MKKDIKDYLHLYLGCEVNYSGTVCKLWGVHEAYCVIGDFNNIGMVKIPTEDYVRLKPIFRRLSDMTEEEKVKMALWEFSNYRTADIVKNDSDNDFFVFRNENGMRCHVNLHHFSAESTRKLLKAGFDLFGLIESGLAIDKTVDK